MFPSNASEGTPQIDPAQVESTCWEHIETLRSDQQCAVLSKLFSKYVSQSITGTLPNDFLELVVRGIKHLKHCQRSNVIYVLAKALGTVRPDQSDSLLPAKRMPMGLIEYAAMFFTSSSPQQVFLTTLLTVHDNLLFTDFLFLVHLIIGPGYRQCTLCLEVNFAKFSQVLYGAMNQ